MTSSNFSFLIWLVSIISVFCHITIYPIFFLFFSFIYTLNLKIRKSENKIIPTALLFICATTLSFIINFKLVYFTNYLKIPINILFLIFSAHFIFNKIEVFVKNWKWIQLLFIIIIYLSFLQILLNVTLSNLWSLPFIGVSDSDEAYKIVDNTIYFGIKEKNIWATKIVFFQIIFFTAIQIKYFKVSKSHFYLIGFISIFNALYTFSRTAQLMFIAFLAILYIWKIFYVYKNIIYKTVLIIFFIIVSIPSGILIYKKLFHISLGLDDGLGTRLELWNVFFNNLKKINFLFGNGILSAEILIKEFTGQPVNNFHNVFFNIFTEHGFIGLTLYCVMLKYIFWSSKLSILYRRLVMFVLFIPFFICVNSQYIGYDSDIVIYFSLVLLIKQIIRYKSKHLITL